MTDRANTDWIRGHKDWTIKVEAPEGTEYFTQGEDRDEAFKAWKLMQKAFAWSSRTTGRDFTLTLLDQNRDTVERVVWDEEWRDWMVKTDRINEKNRRIAERRRRRNGGR